MLISGNLPRTFARIPSTVQIFPYRADRLSGLKTRGGQTATCFRSCRAQNTFGEESPSLTMACHSEILREIPSCPLCSPRGALKFFRKTLVHRGEINGRGAVFTKYTPTPLDENSPECIPLLPQGGSPYGIIFVMAFVGMGPCFPSLLLRFPGFSSSNCLPCEGDRFFIAGMAAVVAETVRGQFVPLCILRFLLPLVRCLVVIAMCILLSRSLTTLRCTRLGRQQ